MMSQAIDISPDAIHRHATEEGERSLTDLYVQSWLDDQAQFLFEATVSFFQFKSSATGELVMNVFGSGFLVLKENRVVAITALSVAEKIGAGDTYMQTALGAVSIARVLCRLDRAQGIAALNVDEIVRANAVMPSRMIEIMPQGERVGANSVLYLGYPGTENAFRRSRRPSSFEGKALMVPYTGDSQVRTNVQQALFMSWPEKAEIAGFCRSAADIERDPKGMIGGPVFEVVVGSKGELECRLMAVAVEYRRDRNLLIAARTQAVELIMNRSLALKAV